MGGQALTATELARVAGVTKQTISAHLAKLVDARLLAVENQGRHRYFRLADRDVAELLESLMGVAYRTGAVRAARQPARAGAAQGARVLRPSCGRARRARVRHARAATLAEVGEAGCNSPGRPALLRRASASMSAHSRAHGGPLCRAVSTGACAAIISRARLAPRSSIDASSSAGRGARKIACRRFFAARGARVSRALRHIRKATLSRRPTAP